MGSHLCQLLREERGAYVVGASSSPDRLLEAPHQRRAVVGADAGPVEPYRFIPQGVGEVTPSINRGEWTASTSYSPLDVVKKPGVSPDEWYITGYARESGAHQASGLVDRLGCIS